MDDEQFQKGAERTIGTLGRLKKSMNFDDTKVNGPDLSPIEKSLDTIKGKFNALEYAGKRFVENITDSAINLAKQAITQTDQITPGYQKYEKQIESVQKLIIATGESMDTVQAMSDKVLAFTDETSYDYSSMLSTLSSFTSSGMGLQDAENTILGMAIAAGEAGVSTEQATHAFMGFQKAISSGTMGSAEWQWIKTAGMNTAALKQAMLDAAVACGDLEQGADGVYYALEETSKGVKKTEVSIANFDSSFASKWLKSDAIVKAMGKYSAAFNQIYKIHEETGKEIYEIIAENSEYLGMIDEFGLKAFKAGQETKTWSNAIEALKSAISSGWMKSFEIIIGNYEQARDFFTDLIEPLYTIFVNGKYRRNDFLEAIFGGGGGVKESVANWDKLATRIEETGHSTEELEDAFKKITGASEDAKVRALAQEYKTLEEAMRDGAIGGDLLKQILNEINGITTETSEAVEDTAASYQQYLETAWAVLRGDYGNGEERRQALEELGLDYEMIQWLAGNLANGMTMDTLTLDWIAQVAPNRYQQFMEILSQAGVVAGEAGQEFIELEDILESVQETEGMTGREIWQTSVLNILHGFADAITAVGDAFDDVFGDSASRGEGIRGWMVRIYEATRGFEISSDTIEKIGEKAKSFFTAIKENSGSVLNFLKMGIQNAGKAFGVFRKGAKLAVGILRDLFGLVKKLFSGRFELPENLQNSETLLAKIAKWLLDIFNKTREFMDTVLTGGGIWSFLDKGLDKIQEIWDKLKDGQGLGSIIRETFGSLFSFGEGEEQKGILGFFSRLFGGFKKDSDEMSDGLLTIADSMDGFSDSVRGLDRAMTGMTNVLEPVSNLLFGDPDELEKKITRLWDRVKKLFVTEYGKINWDTLLDVGKLGLIGYLFTKTKSFFGSLTGTLKNGNNKLGTIRGLIASLQGVVDSIKAPFNAMSKAITNSEKADRYLKIAAAIGILAWSIAKLTEVDEQKFFNVAVTLGMLMMVMAQMAKNMDGFQLFSNNVKQISKNNQSSASVLEHLGESLKNFLSIDLSNFQGKLKINVFSQVAQTLIGAAILLTAIVHALIKLKDITQPGELEKLYPAFIVIGGILVAMTAMVGALALFTSKSKYLGKTGWTMLSMVASLFLIVQMIKSFSSMTDENTNWKAMMNGFWMIIGILGAMSLVLFAAGTMANGNLISSTKPVSILAVVGIMLAIGVLVRSIAKTIDMASKFTNILQGIGIVAGILIAIVGILLLMRWIVKDPMVSGGKMAGVAASLLILAVAIAALSVPIGILSSMNLKPEALLASAAALGILVLAAAGAMAMLANVPVKKLLLVAAVMGIVAIVLGLLMGAASLFAATMIGIVTGVPWEELQDRVQAFDAVLRPELGLLLGLGAAAMMFGIGCAGAALAAGVFGLSFLAISAGIYIVAAALPKLVDAIIYFMQQLQEHGWEIVSFIALVITAILAVMIARKLEIAKTVVGIVTTVVEALKDGVLIGKVLSVIAMFADKALAMLIVLAPIFSEKLVNLIVKLVWSVAEALNAKSGQLIAAFEALIGTLFSIGIKALANLSGDLLGFLGDFIAEIIRAVAPNLGAPVADWIEKHLGSEAFEGAAQAVSNAADRALERSFMNSEFKPDITTDANVTVKNADVSIEEARWRPGQDANIIYDSTESVSVSGLEIEVAPENVENAGSDAAVIVMDEFEQELTGQGESKGFPGIMSDVFGSSGNLIPAEEMQASISGVIGGTDMLGMFSTNGENGIMSYIGGITSGAQGEDATTSLDITGGNIFNLIGNSFISESNANTPSLAENLVNGIGNWITTSGSPILQSIGRFMYGEVQTGVETAGDISSPSKEMGKEGRWMVLGLAKGLIDNSDIAYGAGADTATGLIDEFRQTMEKVALIASDDFDISPTITPVVDLSKVHEAAGLMNGSFGSNVQIPLNLTGSINRRMNDIERVASGMASRQQEINNSNDNITVNIYASEGMDENAVADAVIDRLGSRYARRGMAYG